MDAHEPSLKQPEQGRLAVDHEISVPTRGKPKALLLIAREARVLSLFLERPGQLLISAGEHFTQR
jgi:hypothetical protein